MSIFADRNIIEIMQNDGQRKNIKKTEKQAINKDFLLRSYYIDPLLLYRYVYSYPTPDVCRWLSVVQPLHR